MNLRRERNNKRLSKGVYLLMILALVFLPCSRVRASSNDERKTSQTVDAKISSLTLELVSLLTKEAESLDDQKTFPQADKDRMRSLALELKSLIQKKADEKKAQSLRDMASSLQDPSEAPEEVIATLDAVIDHRQGEAAQSRDESLDGVKDEVSADTEKAAKSQGKEDSAENGKGEKTTDGEGPGGLPEGVTVEKYNEDFQAEYIPLLTGANKKKDWLELEWPPRLFQPKVRIYFDTGSDDDGEIDIFEDGALDLTLNVVEIHGNIPKLVPSRLEDNLKLGPTLGFGIGTRPSDSDDGTKDASGAPVLLLSAGMKLEWAVKRNISKPKDKSTDLTKKTPIEPEDKASDLGRAPLFGIECGYAQGWTTDEGFNDIDDGAIYFGMTGRFW